MVNNGLLLLGVESLMAGLTTGMPMSPGYGGYQTTTTASDCTTTIYSTTSYYTEASKSPEILFFPEFHHQVIGVLHNYVCSASLLHRGSSTTLLSATPPRLQLITPLTVENYTEVPKYYSAPSYTTLTEAAKYYVASTFYTTFYTTAAPSYYAEPKYYTEDPVCYTATYATLCYYTEALK
ncbi:uncharacterized protein LOC124198312 [Daphnia pulex]|uniref:uncharacterized protein LOC124197595 n=1 Tax=Daphnia pulex TaxID=6669 RepID=UPI001EE150F5|nr:uncharacterized protein LOC124197595 [Daphnia pulex]XP_046450085.1 uncharacterized protein LOC124198312 [Daphnia pulex]